jgi:hypothetical protein
MRRGVGERNQSTLGGKKPTGPPGARTAGEPVWHNLQPDQFLLANAVWTGSNWKLPSLTYVL